MSEVKMFKKIITATIITAAAFTIAGCSNTTTQNPTSSVGSTINIEQYEKIIDVRTIEEWNTGYLQGAVRIGIEAADFTTQLEQLNKTSDYFIYCRSGNRAGQAISIMRDMGFTGELVNGGSVAEASQMLNISVVQ